MKLQEIKPLFEAKELYYVEMVDGDGFKSKYTGGRTLYTSLQNAKKWKEDAQKKYAVTYPDRTYNIKKQSEE